MWFSFFRLWGSLTEDLFIVYWGDSEVNCGCACEMVVSLGNKVLLILRLCASVEELSGYMDTGGEESLSCLSVLLELFWKLLGLRSDCTAVRRKTIVLN